MHTVLLYSIKDQMEMIIFQFHSQIHSHSLTLQLFILN